MTDKKRKISILGSTGSIGRQALEVIDKLRDKFEIIALAGGNNVELLKQQAEKYKPKYSIRISQKNFGYNKDKNIKSVPLYAVFCINLQFSKFHIDKIHVYVIIWNKKCVVATNINDEWRRLWIQRKLKYQKNAVHKCKNTTKKTATS